MANLSILKFGGKELCLLKFYLQILVYLQMHSFVANNYKLSKKLSTLINMSKLRHVSRI